MSTQAYFWDLYFLRLLQTESLTSSRCVYCYTTVIPTGWVLSPFSVRLQYRNQIKTDSVQQPRSYALPQEKKTQIHTFGSKLKTYDFCVSSESGRGSSAWLTISEIKFGFQVKRHHIQCAEITILANRFL